MRYRRRYVYRFWLYPSTIAFVLLFNWLILTYLTDNSSLGYTDVRDDITTSPLAADVLTATPCTVTEVELALVVGSVIDARDAATCVKTILYHRRMAPVRLHIIVTQLTGYIIGTVLSSWPITQVNYQLYEVSDSVVGSWSLMKFHLPKVLPSTVSKVLFVDVKMRLVTDIGILWQSVINSLTREDLAVGLVTRPNCTEPPVQCWTFNLIALDLETARKWSETERLTNLHSQAEVNTWLSTHSQMIFPIDCSWALEFQKGFNQTTCLHFNPVQGIAWAGAFTSTYAAHPDVETAVESVTIVVNSEPLSRPWSLLAAEPCRWSSSTDVQPSVTSSSSSSSSSDSCAHFRHVAALRRRTHPFYVAADVNSTRSPDVTLATQLTVDRFSVLERMLANWPGPASITLHVRDAEVEMVTSVIQSSATLRRRTNVAFHVVYQRQAYNPINYLRNVAINNSRTAYTFYVDVDLVPGPAVYDSLCRRVAELHRSNQRNVALVVPSFEAFTDLPKVPGNKSELLSLMAADKVAGYSMKHGWNLGHKPTNYARWVNANESYDVEYRNAFEPYVVVPSDSEPRFDERLLERMADKALYCRWLHGAGFILRVVPDVFVIHLPHARSPGLVQWQRTPGYGRCASIISDESKAELRRRYPDVKF